MVSKHQLTLAKLLYIHYLFKMNILAIDFSTASKKKEGTGYAFRTKDGELIVGSLKGYASKLKAWDRTYNMAQALKDLVEEHELQDYHVYIEEPIVGRGIKGSINLINCNGYFLGLISGFTDGFTFVPNSKWAAFNLISGKREERKKQSCDIMNSDLGLNSDDDNMADAYGILKYIESLA